MKGPGVRQRRQGDSTIVFATPMAFVMKIRLPTRRRRRLENLPTTTDLYHITPTQKFGGGTKKLVK